MTTRQHLIGVDFDRLPVFERKDWCNPTDGVPSVGIAKMSVYGRPLSSILVTVVYKGLWRLKNARPKDALPSLFWLRLSFLTQGHSRATILWMNGPWPPLHHIVALLKPI